MALIKCPKCGNEVSDVATMCFCGFPINKSGDNAESERPVEPVIKNANNDIGLLSTKSWLFYAVALFCFLFPFYNVSAGIASGGSSGIQIVMNKATATIFGESGTIDDAKLPASSRLLTAFAALALFGGIFSLLRQSNATIASAAGVVAVICLIIALLIIRDDEPRGFTLTYGVWLASLLSLVGSIVIWKFKKNTNQGGLE